jgi:hypothetical protein
MKKLINILILSIIIFFTSCDRPPKEKGEMMEIDTISNISKSKTISKDSTKVISTTTDSTKFIFDSLNFKLSKLKLTMDDSSHTKLITNIIKQEEKKIGEIHHVIKDTMFYDVIDTVEMTISYNCPKEIIVDEVKTFKKYKVKGNNIKKQSIKITPEMRARLIDPSGNSFIIIPVTDTVQIVEMKDSTYTLWQWRVTPIRYGDQYLVLSVDMIIGGHKKSIHIYQDEIHVYISFWTRTWIFIETYWDYITFALTGLFALIGWIWQKEILAFFKKLF